MLAEQTAILYLFQILLVTAACRDLATFTIPNWISISALAAFLPAALLLHLPLATIGVALGVGFGALILGIIMFALRWIGGGDAKLMAVCGVWLGWSAFLPFLALTCVAGGVLAVVLLALRNQASWLPVRTPQWLRRLATPGESVPYGVAIAAGALAVLPNSPVAMALGRPMF